jgi:hypothetical protein
MYRNLSAILSIFTQNNHALLIKEYPKKPITIQQSSFEFLFHLKMFWLAILSQMGKDIFDLSYLHLKYSLRSLLNALS